MTISANVNCHFELLDFDFSPTFQYDNGKTLAYSWVLLGTEDGDSLQVNVDLVDLCSYLQVKGIIDDFFVINANGTKEFVIEFGGGSTVDWSPSRQDAVERFYNTCTVYSHNITDLVTIKQLEDYFNHPETVLDTYK
jgi:hypothetical protein